MQIYNITQEKVTELVNKAFDSDEVKPENLCLCYQCRLDVICYVLNRAKPIYVLSERGIAHLDDDYSSSLQDLADLTTLIKNGMQLVAQAKRKHHLDPIDTTIEEAKAYYNFPTITGTVLSGETFAPIESKVTLLMNDKIAEMRDSRWENPIQLNTSSKTSYLFWPKYIVANYVGEKKVFQFHLQIESEGYETTPHFFEIELTAEERPNLNFQAHNSYTCNNILLFKEN